jgi:hypothetical protein
MIGVNGVGVLKKEEYLASPSRFQNCDDALNELTRRLYEGEYYNTPNSSIFILYNLKLHRFQTLACYSFSIQYGNVYARVEDEIGKVKYPLSTNTIVEIKTSHTEFDDYNENIRAQLGKIDEEGSTRIQHIRFSMNLEELLLYREMSNRFE